MLQHGDPFGIVKSYWGNKPITADTTMLGINLDSSQGAFESFILAILYTIEDPGKLAEDTFRALRAQGLTDINLLSSTKEGSPTWGTIVTTFEQYYKGRLKNRKTAYITEGARHIAENTQLKGDLRNLHLICSGNGVQMLNRLWEFKGLAKKAFWVMREMRMQRVWDIDGKYCCVPDKQVGSSLERWGKISGWKQNQYSLHFLMNCSDIVWQAFGELYDFPIFDYSRIFNCNDDRSRKCQQCSIVACNARSTHVTFLGNEVDDKKGEMSTNNEESLKVYIPAKEKELLKSVARDEFGVAASILAQVWIIERLKQYLPADVLLAGASPPGNLPNNCVNITVNDKMKKYENIAFYQEDRERLGCALPQDKTQVIVVYAGKENRRIYNPKRPPPVFKLAEIYRDGASAGTTIRVTVLVPCKRYKVELI